MANSRWVGRSITCTSTTEWHRKGDERVVWEFRLMPNTEYDILLDDGFWECSTFWNLKSIEKNRYEEGIL